MFLPTITPVSTASIVNGQPNDATEVKNGFDNINTYLTGIDNQLMLGVVTTNTTLVANRDIAVYVDASAGAITITLPAGSAHTTQPIFIAKADISNNAVIINAVGTDKIQDPYNRVLVPTATSFSLLFHQAYIALYPVLSSGVYYWRVMEFSESIPATRAYKDNAQTITTTSTPIAFNVDTGYPTVAAYDNGGIINSTTGVITVPRSGVYSINYSVTVDSGSSATSNVFFVVNGSNVAVNSQPNFGATTNAFVNSGHTVQRLNSGDSCTINASMSAGSRSLFSTGSTRQIYTYVEFTFLSRLP